MGNMRRWLFLASLSAALLSTPLWAQRGGGGHGGSMGGRGGFSGGGGVAAHGGGYGYHGSTGYAHVPSYGGYHGGSYSGGSHGSNGSGSYWHGNGGNNGWHGNGWNNGWHGHGWNNGWYGRGWGWRGGYPYWGWGYPYWGWGWYGGLGWYDSSYYGDGGYYGDSGYAQNYPSYVYVTPSGSSDNSQAYEVQQDEIDRLNNEVEHLRAGGSSQSSASQPQGKTTEIHAETVLVYRDGHTEEVQNYAIVGKTIWVFNEQRAKKVPLADLDLQATKRDNEDRGIDFVVPNSAKK